MCNAYRCFVPHAHGVTKWVTHRISNQIKFITAEGPRLVSNTATVSHDEYMVEKTQMVHTIMK